MTTNHKTTASSDWLTLVRQKVETLRFGVVAIAVHDGRVVQIERTEKTRLDQLRSEPAWTIHDAADARQNL